MEYENDLNIAVSLAATALAQPANAMDYLVNHGESFTDPIFILDAIAHVCISTVDDAFAVACSVDTLRDEVYLFVSSRKAANAATADHLQKLWDLMKRISFGATEAQETRALSRDTKELDNMISRTYTHLSREVYSFGYAAFRVRFLYWVEELRRVLLKQPISSLPLFDDFFKLLASITDCHTSMNMVEQPEPTEQCWDDFVYKMDCMTRLAFDILQRPGLCEAWSKALNWPDHDFILGKAMQEITYTHRVSHRLLFYAHNPDLPIYHMSLVIIPTSSYSPCITRWPASMTEWQALYETVRSRRNYVPVVDSTEFDFNPPPSPQRLTVHPECALIEFLHWVGIICGPSFTPPFSYIGLSTAPCMSCDIWIRGYVSWTRYAGEYTTRGCSGRWEPDCALPRLEKVTEQRLAEVVLGHLCGQEERLGRIRRRHT